MTFGELAMRTCKTGVDKTGLGWWAYTLFKGQNGCTTRIISAYQPNHSQRCHLNSIYSQHLQYFQQKGEWICPRKAMVLDLGQALQKWRQEGESLVLLIDANDNMTDGYMQCMLSKEGLNMREVAISRHPRLPKTPTYLRGDRLGKVPMDGCWVMDDLPELRAGWLEADKGAGDHQFLVVEFDSKVLLGDHILWIVRPPT